MALDANVSRFYDSSTADLFAHATQIHAEGNFVISPLSILYATLLLHLGSRGKSASQISEALRIKEHFGSNDVDFLSKISSSSKLRTASSELNTSAQLFINNALFADKLFQIDQQYASKANSHFGAPVVNTDFARDPDGARVTINEWIANHTQGKIKTAIPNEMIDALTRLVIVNTVYFKAKWEKEFGKGFSEKSFKNFDGSLKNMTFMEVNLHKINYFKDAESSFEYVEIPYRNGEASFLIVSPTSPREVRRMAKGIDSTFFKEMRKKVRELGGPLFMPRFNAASGTDLGVLWNSMGITEVFDVAKADLSGISQQEQLYVSDAIHQATIDVDEEGTEASAASAVMVANKMAFEETVVIDRPFIFAVRHDPTDIILFIGRLERL